MNLINKKEYFDISDDGTLAASVDFIRNTLSEAKIDRKLIAKAVLISEDSIAGLLKHSRTDKRLSVRIRKAFGEAEITISAAGTEYDPYVEILAENPIIEDEQEGDALATLRSIYIKAQGESYKYSYKRGINKIRILTGESEKSMLMGTLIGLFLGLLFGVLLKTVVPQPVGDMVSKYALEPVKTIFMNALKIIIAPMVFFSIVSCVSGFKDLSQLGRIGTKVISMYFATTVLAVLLAMFMFTLIKPGTWGFALSMTGEISEVSVETNVNTSLLQTIIGIVPSNFAKPFLDSDTLQIIFLAFLCGIAVGMIGEYSDFLKNFFDACNSLFLTITTLITKIIPLAVFCSVAIMLRELGGESLISVLGFAATTIFILFCMIMSYGLIILIFGRLNPITFFKKNSEGMLTSLTLASSSAAMPTNMRTCTDKLGISSKVCSFSIPLGATINMDGTCIFLVTTGLFLARAYGIEVPAGSFLQLAVTIILLSLGCPGVPGAGLVCIGIVLASIGVPIEAMGLIIAIDPIIDMVVTMSNTTGDVMTALIVAKKEKLLDVDKYNS